MIDAGPLSADARGVRLAVRLSPRASRDEVTGMTRDADDRLWIDARVRALPDKGKANTAVEKLIAGEIGVAKTSVSVISGSTNRNKILHIEGDPGELMPLVSDWLEGLT